jgi:hypothetical protein
MALGSGDIDQFGSPVGASRRASRPELKPVKI